MSQRTALEMLAGGATLDEVIEFLIKTIERNSGSRLVGSVALLDETGRQFVDSIGPGLPHTYHEAVRGMLVSSQTDSCCRAVTDRETVVVEDVTADPQWSRFAEFIAPLGFRSAWSTPIFGTDGAILGTFANYGRGPQSPTASDFVFVEGITRTVALAVERKRADQALRESEERFRAFVSASADVIYRMSPDWSEMRELDGRGFLPELGAPDQKWMERYVLPEDRSAVRKRIDRAIASKSMFEFEHRVVRADGTAGWTLSRAVPILDEGGAIAEWFGSAQDVTIRRRAEEALRESEERLRILADNMAQLAWICDSLGNVIWYNKRWLDYTGMTFEDMKGWDWSKVQHPDHVDRVVATVKRSAESGDPWEDTFPLRGRDGRYRWFLSRAIPVRNASGEITSWFGTNTDIDDATRADDLLRESEERLQFVARATRDIIWDIDLVNDRVRWGPAMESQMGYAPKDIGPDTAWCMSHIHPDDRERIRQGMKAAAEGKEERWSDTFRYLKADGSYADIQDQGFIVRNRRGKALRMIGAMQDITERRQAEERQTLLVAELQHRVRNILATLRAVARRTAETNRSAEDYARHLEGRLDSMARTQALLTRDPDRGVDLQEMVRDELVSIAAEPERYRCRGPDVVLGPKAAEVLSLAVHELATNAVKYGAFSAARGGRVDVGWTVQDRNGVDWLVFEWKEIGGPEVASPARRGFGTELITRRVPYELKGRGSLDPRPGGMEALIEFPLIFGNSIFEPGPAGRSTYV